ncbi:hypothetical protein QTP86_003665 [Hemibagrus guttatus]|nr:hypothetical protein QTP86_003665 [Hemibagrus guttatus]
MKLWERVVEARLRKVVEICEQQYGFMPRKSTTDAIFALRILMEKYRDGQRELHCVFVDLEKAYDRVPREELWYCMRKSGVAEKYVRVVQNMYERSRTVVRCAVGQTEEFKVEVGLHQGSALSPFLFAIVMDQLSEEVRQESPWTMMFADDMVICSESREQVEENLERWRFALERRGMKVSRSKTEYMCVNEREGSGTVRLQGEEVKKVQEFKYLGSTVQSNGECGKERRKNVSLTFDLDDKLPAEGPDWRESKTNLPWGRCPTCCQRRRVPAAPCSHPPAPWGVPDPRKTDIIAPEPSFVGGRRSVRVLGGGRHSALLLGGGRRLALRLGCGRHSALLLGCGRRSAPPLRCGRRVGPFGLAVGSFAPPTCLAPASHSPHVPCLDPRSPHLPRLGPHFPPLALLLLLAPPPKCLALLLAPPTGLSTFLAPPQDPSLDRTFWEGLGFSRKKSSPLLNWIEDTWMRKISLYKMLL